MLDLDVIKKKILRFFLEKPEEERYTFFHELEKLDIYLSNRCKDFSIRTTKILLEASTESKEMITIKGMILDYLLEIEEKDRPLHIAKISEILCILDNGKKEALERAKVNLEIVREKL